MKLNEHSKNELRKEIEEVVKRVPEGQRIELPLDLLDDLIFLKIKDKDGVTVKFPIWTGEFLRKIDLSKLSFENVCFSYSVSSLNMGKDYDERNFLMCNLTEDGDYYIPIIKNGIVLLPDDKEKFWNSKLIDFSYTNINVDFSKIYGNRPMIKSTSFEGVDLSNSNFSILLRCDNVNFSKTNVIVDLSNNKRFYECDFSNNNFRNITINFDEFINIIFDGYGYYSLSNFSNTGLNIIYDYKTIPKEILDDRVKIDENGETYYDSIVTEDEEVKKLDSEYEIIFENKMLLDELLKRNFLGGCYLNGKLIENDEKKFIDSTLSDIEEQIRGFKGK